MAKKPTPKKAVQSKKTPASKSSDVRNSPVPKKVVATGNTSAPRQRQPVTREMIAQRAFEISQSGYSGGELDNWLRAEREIYNS